MTAADTGMTAADTGMSSDTGISSGDTSVGPTYTVGGTVTGLVGTVVLVNNGADNLSLNANGMFMFSNPSPTGAAYAVTVLTQPAGETCTVTNGTGTVAGANVTTVEVACTSTTMGGDGGGDTSFDAGGPFTIGGTISGLSGSVVLQDNAGNNLTVTTNGNFVFTTPIAAGGAYAVTVLTQPTMPVQTCAVASGSGTATANVTNVTVTCTTAQFTVGGTISGLDANDSVVLQDNAGNNLTVTQNGTFTFTTSVASGAPYAVTVLTQPTMPAQTCTVTAGTGSGTVGSANVTSVAVTCGAVTFTVGGTVTGLTGTVVLQDNGGNNLPVTANGMFTFTTPLMSGAAYAVTVLTNPNGETCGVSAGTGTVGSSNVTSVVVNCSSQTYTIGGSITGLSAGDSVLIQDNGGDNSFVSQNGTFAFPTPLANGAAYAVTIKNNPTAPIIETCTIMNGSGTVMSMNVTTVEIACVPTGFTVGGTVKGLLAGQSVTLEDNGGNQTVVAGPSPVAGTTFTFSQPVLSGSTYNVTVGANPTTPFWQTCTVASAMGTVTSANVTNVAVTCTIGGSGVNGAAPSSGPINGIATAVSGSANANTSTATVTSTAGFAAGQIVLFHQSQHGSSGVWELDTVSGISGSNLVLLQPLQNSYSAPGAQVVVVPQYTGANITGTGANALTAPAWNGNTGGILAFMSSGAVTVSGQISMTGLGFRGGGFANTATNCAEHCAFGVQGESPFGVGTNGGGTLGTLAALAANGAGGGGGAAGQDCGNAGGGAYGGNGTVGVNNTNGTCSTGADGNSAGGTLDGVADQSSTILFGGAGGEGGYDEDGTLPGNGGNGGGIIIIIAPSITVSGSIVSGGTVGGNGNSGGCPFAGGTNGGGCGMGGGGGGAGGGIQLAASTAITLGTNLVTSNGANGGTCSCGSANSGAGSVGRIGVNVAAGAGAVSGATTPAFDFE